MPPPSGVPRRDVYSQSTEYLQLQERVERQEENSKLQEDRLKLQEEKLKLQGERLKRVEFTTHVFGMFGACVSTVALWMARKCW